MESRCGRLMSPTCVISTCEQDLTHKTDLPLPFTGLIVILHYIPTWTRLDHTWNKDYTLALYWLMDPLFTSNKVKLDNNQQIQAGIYTNQRTILLVEITILQAAESLLHNQLKPEQNLLNQLQYLNQLSGSKPQCKIDTGITSLPHNILFKI